ncbi:hypothetical protein CCZ01_03570 [Helicobacter monodelphidis]|uniref:hypothetical protein n=1 Tax=Helicobacter sp. 15-1451 TaxID=2004995 RepID=UPI000DCBD058|nr:hypothetical protein [Helicobacter sp. 15-1451]RAX58165.1 hypothetical protein CCZ01_03570 [Helicobacter sp. 15-1451]
MHGKIVSYQDFTGRGVVINISKTLFDFNKESWHDPKIVPTVGLYVEYRADGQRVTDIHSSKFQNFSDEALIREYDFWRTETDDQLEEITEKARMNTIKAIYRTTNYANLQDIDVTITVAQAIKNYFTLENATIDMLGELAKDSKTLLLNYHLMKRFILKALDTFLFLDKTITRDRFLQYTGVITRLENSYRGMVRYNNMNTKVLFEEYFLRYQTHYQALVAAISGNQESLSLCSRQEKVTGVEIQKLRSKLEILQAKKVAQENKGEAANAKVIANIEQEMATIQDSIDDKTQALEGSNNQFQNISQFIDTLTAIKDSFYKRHYDTFNVVFQSNFNRITKKLKEGLDLCGTLLDDQIWELSSKSASLKGQYFKGGAEENLCAVNFARLYLSHLDKALLRDTEEELYRYCQKIDKQEKKYYLIISNNVDLMVGVKVKLLMTNKYNIIKVAHKLISLQSSLSEIVFEMIYVDEDIESLTVEQVKEEIQDSKLNRNVEIQMISKVQKVDGLKIRS